MPAPAKILEPVEVENPLWSRAHDGRKDNPRFIEAVRNLNESPLALLHSRGTIDDAQAEAGLLFRRYWETLTGGYSSELQEPVDTSGVRDTFTERKARAGKKLQEASVALYGVRRGVAYPVVRMVCAEGLSIRKTMRRMRMGRVKTVGVLRTGLDVLADVWGLS